MNFETKVKIPKTALKQAIRLAYSMSAPKGLGFLHAREGELDDETVDAIVRPGPIAARMDYIHGRACKFNVYRNEQDELYVAPTWYDHTAHDLETLLRAVGVDNPRGAIHTATLAQEAENAKWDAENRA